MNDFYLNMELQSTETGFRESPINNVLSLYLFKFEGLKKVKAPKVLKERWDECSHSFCR